MEHKWQRCGHGHADLLWDGAIPCPRCFPSEPTTAELPWCGQVYGGPLRTFLCGQERGAPIHEASDDPEDRTHPFQPLRVPAEPVEPKGGREFVLYQHAACDWHVYRGGLPGALDGWDADAEVIRVQETHRRQAVAEWEPVR